jgi:hypothetical protein
MANSKDSNKSIDVARELVKEVRYIENELGDKSKLNTPPKPNYTAKAAEMHTDIDGMSFEDFAEMFSHTNYSKKVILEAYTKLKDTEKECELPQDYFEAEFKTYRSAISIAGSLDAYIDAVRFCCLKAIPGVSISEAFEIVFPAKAKEYKRKNALERYANIYNSRSEVVEIDKMMIIPTYIEKRPLFNYALQKLKELSDGHAAHGAKVSPHVQYLAASKIVDITKIPDENSIQIKVGLNDQAQSLQDVLFSQLREKAIEQKKAIESGHDIIDVQDIGVDLEDFTD